jgi:hypothetical protein
MLPADEKLTRAIHLVVGMCAKAMGYIQTGPINTQRLCSMSQGSAQQDRGRKGLFYDGIREPRD